MGKYNLVVFTNPAEGKEEEFNQWYDEQHLGEVCEVPGFTGARRMKVVDGQDDPGEYRYIAVYDIEGDATAAVTELRARANSGKIYMSDALGPDPKAILCEAIEPARK